jgi:G:T-mismatch repair DNA endonuclease (very short patch repair protein)
VTKRKGKFLEELSTIQRVKVGGRRLTRPEVFNPDPIITIHRRGLNVDDYRPPDPREAWATPQDEMPSNGTLPERVVHKVLTDRHMEFDFQSSLLGGRVFLGGLVADFMISRPPVCIRVQGRYWHGEFDTETGNLESGELSQARRDDDQRDSLEELGYYVIDFWEEIADTQHLVDDWARKYIDPLLFGIVGMVSMI